jgi:hypothetical protein
MSRRSDVAASREVPARCRQPIILIDLFHSPGCLEMTFSRILILACMLLVAAVSDAAPLRFDLSAATGRKDAETPGWREWEIGSVARAMQAADGVEIEVRGVGGKLEGFLHKPGLADGATLASDGVVCEGEAVELTLKHLSPGRHSLATFHSVVEEGAAELIVSVGGERIRVTPTPGAVGSHALASAYLVFEAEASKPVVVRIEPATPGSGRLVLNALELDAANPTRRTTLPSPADFDWHVAGETGEVSLGWQPVPTAKSYRVFFASADNEHDARHQVAEAAVGGSAELATVTEPAAVARVAARNSLTFYAWRVDAIEPDGTLAPGETWCFRVRHRAFPSAEGYGRFARGGRGGRVIKVTNLNDRGPGSLRDAVEAVGPRTVVFDVGGRIVLESRLSIRSGELTVAGQTAPGKGICLSNYNFGGMGAEDVIVRYLRVRPGDTSGMTLDGMGLASCDHAIVDHCSISWTQDESFSSRGARNITLQRTLISEALNIAGHKKYEAGKSHGFAASIGGDIGSFHHNLLAHCAGRNWSLAGGTDQANRHRGRLDIRNNVVYNWEHRTTDGGASQVQFVNNYYKPGPATRVFHVLKPEREWTHVFGPQDYYVVGNVMEGHYGAEDRYAGVVEPKEEPLESFIYDEPFFPADVETESAEQAFESVLDDVGCNFPELDQHDQRVLHETRSGTTTYVGSKSGKPGLPDSQRDVGGWEDYPHVERPADWDPDHDGMPTQWELARGLDPSDPSDGPLDPDGDGYTNLEDYLNELH